MIRIGFSVAGVAQVDARLDRLDVAAANLFSTWLKATELLEAAEQSQFESEGAFGSGGWKPLSEAYAAWKEQHYPGKPILQREGALFDSLTEQAAPGAIRDIFPNFMQFGTSVPYAVFHQEGTDTMPARPPLIMPPATRVAITALIQKVLSQAMGEA